jgi:hypothetical protein
MRAISALLPWYTRPIVQFSHMLSRTVQTTANILNELVRAQEQLDGEIHTLRSALAAERTARSSEQGTTAELS